MKQMRLVKLLNITFHNTLSNTQLTRTEEILHIEKHPSPLGTHQRIDASTRLKDAKRADSKLVRGIYTLFWRDLPHGHKIARDYVTFWFYYILTCCPLTSFMCPVFNLLTDSVKIVEPHYLRAPTSAFDPHDCMKKDSHSNVGTNGVNIDLPSRRRLSSTSDICKMNYSMQISCSHTKINHFD